MALKFRQILMTLTARKHQSSRLMTSKTTMTNCGVARSSRLTVQSSRGNNIPSTDSRGIMQKFLNVTKQLFSGVFKNRDVPGKLKENRWIKRKISFDDDQDRRIFELSSSANTNKADFENKYFELSIIGKGGFSCVYAGLRKSDHFPVAIKYMYTEDVILENVNCQGKQFNILLEVALLLKAAGLPGSVGRSAVVSPLDWYNLDDVFVLVMERPQNCMDLRNYLIAQGGSLSEYEAKVYLKQLVDTAIDMHSKCVFHRDIKLENILVETVSGTQRVRLIDFGCGCLSSHYSYREVKGTQRYFPPEWFETQRYWARPTTVWQLGALFYILLNGDQNFTTLRFINNQLPINNTLSKEVRSLLDLCLVRDPRKRATLRQLQLHPALRQMSPPLV